MTTDDKPTLPARYYVLFCDWLKSIGVNVERLLNTARIDTAGFLATVFGSPSDT